MGRRVPEETVHTEGVKNATEREPRTRSDINHQARVVRRLDGARTVLPATRPGAPGTSESKRSGVPGVEPGSAEPLASASLSAAVGELFVRWDPNGGLPFDYPELIFVPRSRIPEDAFRIAAPGPGEADTHRADGLLFS